MPEPDSEPELLTGAPVKPRRRRRARPLLAGLACVCAVSAIAIVAQPDARPFPAPSQSVHAQGFDVEKFVADSNANCPEGKKTR